MGRAVQSSSWALRGPIRDEAIRPMSRPHCCLILVKRKKKTRLLSKKKKKKKTLVPYRAGGDVSGSGGFARAAGKRAPAAG